MKNIALINVIILILSGCVQHIKSTTNEDRTSNTSIDIADFNTASNYRKDGWFYPPYHGHYSAPEGCVMIYKPVLENDRSKYVIQSVCYHNFPEGFKAPTDCTLMTESSNTKGYKLECTTEKGANRAFAKLQKLKRQKEK